MRLSPRRGRSCWCAAWLALLFPWLAIAAPAREPPPITPGDPESKLIPYLNFRWPERQGIVAGSCLVKSANKGESESWIYVLLPRSSKTGALVQILPDRSSGPVFVNGGDLRVDNASANAELVQGGVGTKAILEGAAEWIMHNHLTIVPTYAQALAVEPALRCPDDTTMMAWRFGHRGRAKPGTKPH